MPFDFATAFRALTGNAPFPWQTDLFENHFSKGKFPPACTLPTGLGKTSVVAVWLLALARNPEQVPRRLVYVVNRRTVVDQTTDEVKKYRALLAHGAPPLLPELIDLADRLQALAADPTAYPFAVSTLRGQLAESNEWWENPARPAVAVGTIDLIGSRLLFQGYRAGLNRRPVYAGFIGHDALLVHDEAHLEPAFQKVVEAVVAEQAREGSAAMADRRLKVMALTATPRAGATPFKLTDAETKQEPGVPGVKERLFAAKGLDFKEAKRDAVPGKVVELALRHKGSGLPVLVFVRTVKDVLAVRDGLTNKKANGVPEKQVQILTGTIRGHERDRLATADPVFRRFLPDPPDEPGQPTVYLVCTSAGEVGVDLSAAHLVCDLTPLDSMAQRFGRVNRRGKGPNAEIDVVVETDPDPKKADDGYELARWATLALLRDPARLTACEWDDARRDVSPAALGQLTQKLTWDQLKAAFTPEPTLLDTTDILFDSWALTSVAKPLVDEQLPGRPPVAEYLHGIEDDEQPDTQFAWRAEVAETGFVPALSGADRTAARKQLEAFLAAYRLRPHELLTERAYNAVRQLKDFAKRAADLPVWVVDARGGIEVKTVGALADAAEVRTLAERVVVLPPAAGGLTPEGLLDAKKAHDDAIDYDVADVFGEAPDTERPRVRFVATVGEEGEPDWGDPLGNGAAFTDLLYAGPRIAGMTRLGPFDWGETDDGRPRRLVAFVRTARADDDDAQSQFSNEPVPLKAHLRYVEEAARRIADALSLPPELRNPLLVAARHHDVGKARPVWQRSVGNLDGAEPWAKSGRGGALFGLDGYRHEFGSLVDVRDHPDLKALEGDQRELALHLIAAHHGRGRPHFPAAEATHPHNGADAEYEAREVPRRFAALQRKYGRWGLAYLESLLRAADAAASADPSKYEGGGS